MKLAEIMKAARIDCRPESVAILRHFPDECDVMLGSYSDGERIFIENDPIIYVGILVQGRYSCSWDIAGRDDYVHISKNIPAMLGDQAALAGLPCYTGTFRAIGKCKVALVRLPDFWLWMERDPDYYKKTAAKHIRTLLNQCQTRRSTVVDQSNIRVIKYLVWYCQLKGGAVGKELPRSLTVRVTRETITEFIGQISLRTVNRILSQMEKDQMINIAKGKICIHPKQYQQMVEILEDYTGGA